MQLIILEEPEISNKKQWAAPTPTAFSNNEAKMKN